MTTSVDNKRVGSVRTTDDDLIVSFADGRTLSVPLAWYPRLLNASAEQRSDWRLIGEGEGIHWSQIDEDLSAEGLLRGIKAAGVRAQSPLVGEHQDMENAPQGGEVQQAAQETGESYVRALQRLSQESANVYTDFLHSALSLYQQTLQSATQIAQSNLQAATQVTQQGIQAAGQAAQQAAQVAQQDTQATQQAAQGSANAVDQEAARESAASNS